MYIYRKLLIALIFAFDTITVYAFVNIPKTINKTVNKTDNKDGLMQLHTRRHASGINLCRQDLYELFGNFPIPYIPLKCKKYKEVVEEQGTPKVSGIPDTDVELRKDVSIEDKLRSLDVSIDDDNYTDTTTTVSAKRKAMIDVVLGNIMDDFKKNGVNAPELSISNLQKYCSTTNVIKNKNPKILTPSFKYSKYSLLLGVFSNYEITGYTRRIVNNTKYYDVDMKVSAPYKTMLQEGIQFNEMYYPKNRYNNNVCNVIYKWTFKKEEDGNIYVEGCYLVPPLQQV